MRGTLDEIAKQLKEQNKKVQLIYAFNGTGKTRLSSLFKDLVASKSIADDDQSIENEQLTRHKFLYFNAFTEDLFYWDNDLQYNASPKLKILPNSFTPWIFNEQGLDGEIVKVFQRYSNEKLTPHFNEAYSILQNYKGGKETETKVLAFSEVTFSYERGNDEPSECIKISKGEESCFIWSVFYTLLEQVIDVLNISKPDERDTDQFNQLEYVFIDDPVSSLDENNLIELAVDLVKLVKLSPPELKFVITTHNPLFYNVLHNEFRSNNKKNPKYIKHLLRKLEDGLYELKDQLNDSPFSYHLYIKNELETAIKTGQIKKYHFNFLRNILEKTSTFLGYDNWGDLLPDDNKGAKTNPYETRIINISSHSKHAGEEVAELTDKDKRVLSYLVKKMNETYHFK